MKRYTTEQRVERRDARQKRRMLRSIFKRITLQPGGNSHGRRKVRRAARFAGALVATSEGVL